MFTLIFYENTESYNYTCKFIIIMVKTKKICTLKKNNNNNIYILLLNAIVNCAILRTLNRGLQ